MRYVIKFSKDSDIKFISHLDLLRTIQKIVKRSGLPVEYSKGFNPHMSIAIAQPLSVGVYSTGEYMDVVFNEMLKPVEIIEKLNASSPMGVRFFEAIYVEMLPNQKNPPQTMAAIDFADYVLKLKYKNTEVLQSEMKTLLEKQEWTTLKKSKKGEKLADIRPLIKSISYDVKKDSVVIIAKIACGSRDNLSAQLLAEFIKSNTTGADMEAFVDIVRNEMYIADGKEVLTLNDYFKSLNK